MTLFITMKYAKWDSALFSFAEGIKRNPKRANSPIAMTQRGYFIVKIKSVF